VGSSQKNLVYWIFSIYALTLSLSWTVQYMFPVEHLPGKHEKQLELDIDGKEYPIRYNQICADSCGNKSVLVLIPDVYFGDETVLPLAEFLSDSFQVIVPDLRAIHNTSFKERFAVSGKTVIIDAIINHLEIDSYHLAGHGYGGLVAVELALQSNSVRSLSLLGSLGVQELRFLGNHHINQSLYSISKPIVQLYKYAFPHFGWAEHHMFSINYIDAMRKIDQRDFRSKAANIKIPVSVFHSENDANVPLITAIETHRIIPHSELELLNDDLPGFYELEKEWGIDVINFLNDVEQGLAKNRSEASEERIQKSEEPFNSSDVEPLHGKALAILILLIIVFTIFSEDLSAIAAGLLAATGILPFHLAVLSCFAGIIIIDSNIYWLGKVAGRPILKQAPFRWLIKESDLTRAQNLYEMYGMELLFIARFVPGARFPTYFSAGLLKSSFKKFFLYFALSVAIWSPILVGLTMLIGQPMMHYLSIYQDYALWILLLTILIIYLIIKVGIPLTTVRGRRRLLVKWARFWERWINHRSY